MRSDRMSAAEIYSKVLPFPRKRIRRLPFDVRGLAVWIRYNESTPFLSVFRKTSFTPKAFISVTNARFGYNLSLCSMIRGTRRRMPSVSGETLKKPDPAAAWENIFRLQDTLGAGMNSV